MYTFQARTIIFSATKFWKILARFFAKFFGKYCASQKFFGKFYARFSENSTAHVHRSQNFLENFPNIKAPHNIKSCGVSENFLENFS
jgi:hypothetical protein